MTVTPPGSVNTFDFLTDDILSEATIKKMSSDEFVLFIDVPDQFTSVRVELKRCIHNWRVCVDVTVDGISWDRNSPLDDAELEQWITIWNRLVDLESQHRDAEWERTRNRV